MWDKLSVRIISSVVAGAIALVLLFLPVWVFNIAVGIACLMILFELFTTFKQERKWQLVILDYAGAIALILVGQFKEIAKQEFLVFIMVAYLMALLICSVTFHHSIKFEDVTSSFFTLVYAVFFLQHLSFVRSMPLGDVLVFLPLLGAFGPDTFAFFSGKLFGKHKLIPEISPNKTVEGSVGAVVGTAIIFAGYGLVVRFACGLSVNYLWLMLLAVLCSIVAQFGDLAASEIKRVCGVKDFGNLIPGHGGLVDRVDSLLFVSPVVYYFVLFLPVVF